MARERSLDGLSPDMRAVAEQIARHEEWCTWRDEGRCNCGGNRRPLAIDRTEDVAPLVVHSLAELRRQRELLEKPPAVTPRLTWKGRATMLSAREKLGGKSTLARSAVSRLSCGDRFLGEPTRPARSLWLGEEHVGDVVRQFVAMGADDTMIDIADVPADGDPMGRVERIARAVAEGEYALVVVDTLAALLAGLKSFDDPALNVEVMTRLVQIARDTDVALLLLAHATKSGTGYRGTTEYGARVDVVVEMERVGERQPRHRKLTVVGRLGTDDFTVIFDDRDYALAERRELPLEMRVRDYITANIGATQRAVEKAVGGRASDVRSAIATLLLNKHIVNQPERKGNKTTHRLYPPGCVPKVDSETLWDASRDAPPGEVGEQPDERGTRRDAPRTHIATHTGSGGASRIHHPKGVNADAPDPDQDAVEPGPSDHAQPVAELVDREDDEPPW